MGRFFNEVMRDKKKFPVGVGPKSPLEQLRKEWNEQIVHSKENAKEGADVTDGADARQPNTAVSPADSGQQPVRRPRKSRTRKVKRNKRGSSAANSRTS